MRGVSFEVFVGRELDAGKGCVSMVKGLRQGTNEYPALPFAYHTVRLAGKTKLASPACHTVRLLKHAYIPAAGYLFCSHSVGMAYVSLSTPPPWVLTAITVVTP